MADDHSPFAQFRRHVPARMSGVAGEDEVCLRRRTSKPRFSSWLVSFAREAMILPRVASNHASSFIAAVAPRLGGASERIGVEAVLDALQRLDQRALADREADAQAGQRA